MSAFIVTDQTMQNVVSGVRTIIEAGYQVGPTIMADASVKKYDELGAKLFQLNQEAVNARYLETDTAPGFRWKMSYPTKMQSYKAMRCLLYQCSEGQVPEQDLYKELTQASNALARMIVEELPAYNEQKGW